MGVLFSFVGEPLDHVVGDEDGGAGALDLEAAWRLVGGYPEETRSFCFFIVEGVCGAWGVYFLQEKRQDWIAGVFVFGVEDHA